MSYRTKEINQEKALISELYPWLKRSHEREKLVIDYIANFKTISTIWMEAVKEGWDLDLWRYVSEIANIQAKMIVGEKVGWNSGIVFGYGKSLDEYEIKIFLENQKQQADTGRIDVAIPTNRIADWKLLAAWAKQTVTEQEVKKFKATRIFNPDLDEYLEKQMAQKIMA